MHRYAQMTKLAVGAMTAAALLLGAQAAKAETAAEINKGVAAALASCKAQMPACNALAGKAKGILVFPEVTKAAVGIGGSYGEGALLVGGTTAAYYSTKSASLGLSIGAQTRSEVIMFLTEAALHQFRTSEGWEVGGSASIVAIDTGKSGSVDTESIKEPVVGFIFGEKGLMADLSFEGAKIAKITP